jgi:hypothetical protein
MSLGRRIGHGSGRALRVSVRSHQAGRRRNACHHRKSRAHGFISLIFICDAPDFALPRLRQPWRLCREASRRHAKRASRSLGPPRTQRVFRIGEIVPPPRVRIQRWRCDKRLRHCNSRAAPAAPAHARLLAGLSLASGPPRGYVAPGRVRVAIDAVLSSCPDWCCRCRRPCCRCCRRHSRDSPRRGTACSARRRRRRAGYSRAWSSRSW